MHTHCLQSNELRLVLTLYCCTTTTHLSVKYFIHSHSFNVLIFINYRFHLLIVYYVIWPHKKNSNISRLPPLHFTMVIIERRLHIFSFNQFIVIDGFESPFFHFVGSSHHHGQHQSSTSSSVHHQQQSPIIDRVTATTPPNLSNLSSDSAYEKFRLLNDHHVSNKKMNNYFLFDKHRSRDISIKNVNFYGCFVSNGNSIII